MGKRLDRPGQEVVKPKLSSAKRTPDLPVIPRCTVSEIMTTIVAAGFSAENIFVKSEPTNYTFIEERGCGMAGRLQFEFDMGGL